MYKIVFGVIVLLLLSSCATKYGKLAMTGGYKDKELINNQIEIEFFGNAFTSIEETASYNLLRAAEIMKEKNYKAFGLISAEVDDCRKDRNKDLSKFFGSYPINYHWTVKLFYSNGGQTMETCKITAVYIGLEDNKYDPNTTIYQIYDTISVIKNVASGYNLTEIIVKYEEDLL
jgi:hypothetical protein